MKQGDAWVESNITCTILSTAERKQSWVILGVGKHQPLMLTLLQLCKAFTRNIFNWNASNFWPITVVSFRLRFWTSYMSEMSKKKGFLKVICPFFVLNYSQFTLFDLHVQLLTENTFQSNNQFLIMQKYIYSL